MIIGERLITPGEKEIRRANYTHFIYWCLSRAARRRLLTGMPGIKDCHALYHSYFFRSPSFICALATPMQVIRHLNDASEYAIF